MQLLPLNLFQADNPAPKDEEMEVLSSSSYPSASSGDSLRDAFASLDAASLEQKNYSLNSSDSLSSILLGPAAGQNVRIIPVNEKEHSPTLLRARRRQDEIQSTTLRPLSGGPTLEEMKMQVEKRNIDARSRLQNRKLQDQQSLQRIVSAPVFHQIYDPGPSFRGFPMSMAEADTLDEEPFPIPDVDQQDAEGEAQEERISPPIPTADPPLQGVENSASQIKRKRTMQWAAKRDRRIARRRDGPPLTRSQAKEKEIQIDRDLPADKDLSKPSSGSHDITAEITDPSIGGDDQEEILPTPKRQRRKKKEIPTLPLTYTETEVVSMPPPNKESGESSLTQSDTSQPAVRRLDQQKGTSRYGVPNPTRSTEIDSSDTEEEQEIRVPQIPKKTATALPNFDNPKEKRQKIQRSPNKSKKPKTDQIPRPRKGLSSKVSMGPRIFYDLTFILFGFWGQIKLFEKLIEKHSGTICKVKSFQEIQVAGIKIDYIVSCTHSGHKPSSIEVNRWKGQLVGADADYLSEVTHLFNTTPMIQADWISECIAKCLRKEDLLSIERHRVCTSL